MNYNRIGFWAALIFMLVSMGRVHEMIPGAQYLALGTLTTVILYVLVAGRFHALRWSPVLVWRILFFCSLLPGLFFGFDHGEVLKVVRSEFAETFAFFTGAILFFRTLDDLRKVRTALMCLCLGLSLWVITHRGHGPGMLGDENDVALALVMLLPFPLIYLFEEKNAVRFLTALAIFFCALAAVATANSRGGMVGTVLVLGACWFRSRRKISTMLLVVLLLGVVIALGPQNLLSRFQSITNTHELTAAQRIFYWGLSWKMFLQTPLFGVGANSWGAAISSHLVATGGYQFHDNTPHSIYFELISDLGLFGIIAWIGLLVSCAFCFRDLLSNRLKSQVGKVLPHNLNPSIILEAETRRIFLSSFGMALGIGLLGFLASGAFLSVLFYPMFCSYAAMMQATRETWRRELGLFAALNQKSP